MFRLITVFWAFIFLGVLLLLGRIVRQRWPLMQALYMPSSVIAGVIGLLLGPAVLGAIAGRISPDSAWVNGMFAVITYILQAIAAFQKILPVKSVYYVS